MRVVQVNIILILTFFHSRSLKIVSTYFLKVATSAMYSEFKITISSHQTSKYVAKHIPYHSKQ